MQPREFALLSKELTMDADRQLALQKTYRVRHTSLRRNAQAQMDVVGHRVPLDDLHSLLLAQLAQDLPDLPAQTRHRSTADDTSAQTRRGTCSTI